MPRALPVVGVRETLPQPFEAWVADLLPEGIPQEKRATCGSCAMASAEAVNGASAIAFGATVKCCSYLPQLRNFQVGAALSSAASPAGIESVRRRIAADASVTPLGIGMTPVYKGLYDRVDTEQLFGRTAALRCPHFIEHDGHGSCGIWQHRNGVCATWFCKHVRAKVGRDFWVELRDLLTVVEAQLATWAMMQMGLAPETMRQVIELAKKDPRTQLGSELVPEQRETYRRAVWGSWYDRREEFFVECHRLVGPLGWKRILEVCGAEVHVRALIVRAAHRRLLEGLPPARLSGSSFGVQRWDQNGAFVATYSPYDPIRLDSDVVNILSRFDGRPTPDVVADLALEGLELEPDLIRALWEFGVLKEA